MERWPGGHTFAATVSFDFDAEEVWIGENPVNAQRPSVLSQGRYGPQVAVPLILDLLQKHQVTSTFFACGRDAERHPQSMQDILSAGHELAHHGYTHTSPTELSAKEEVDELRRGKSALEACGTTVTGYRSPSWELSAQTLGLLAAHGFDYSSNLLDDIVPYRHSEHDLVEVPVSWILDDAPHFWFANDTWDKTIRSPREVSEVWLPEIDGLADLGAHVMLTMHPMIIGRPSRLAFLDRVLAHLRERGAWIAPARDVAVHTRTLRDDDVERR